MRRLINKSVGVEGPISAPARDADRGDRRIEQGCPVRGAVEPHGTDIGISTHGAVLSAGGAHHVVAHSARRLLGVVGTAPRCKVGVIAHCAEAVLSPRRVQPNSESVRVARSNSCNLRNWLLRRLSRDGGDVRGGNKACDRDRGRDGRWGSSCDCGDSDRGHKGLAKRFRRPDVQRPEGQQHKNCCTSVHPDGVSIWQRSNSLEPTQVRPPQGSPNAICRFEIDPPAPPLSPATQPP